MLQSTFFSTEGETTLIYPVSGTKVTTYGNKWKVYLKMN